MEKNPVAQIGTLGTMAARGVTRDVTRILGKPYGFGDMIAKMIPLTPGIKLQEAIDDSDELKALIKENDEAAEVIDLALKLEGCARSIGKHAAGVVTPQMIFMNLLHYILILKPTLWPHSWICTMLKMLD